MPQTDIYGKVAKKASSGFSIDKAQMTFTGLNNKTGLLVQSVQIQYQQQISFVYDLAAPDDVYYVAGRTNGTAVIGKMVGSGGMVEEFYKKFGDVCRIEENITFSGLGGCTTGSKTATVTLANPVITQLGLQMSVDTALISENIQMMFASLTLGSGNAGNAGNAGNLGGSDPGNPAD
jgi:hypothetical protein